MLLTMHDLLEAGVVRSVEIKPRVENIGASLASGRRDYLLACRSIHIEFAREPLYAGYSFFLDKRPPHAFDNKLEDLLLDYGFCELEAGHLPTDPSAPGVVPAYTETTSILTLLADQVLGDRWPRAERALLRCGGFVQCLEYARRVVRGRWPRLERAMLRHLRNRETSPSGETGQYFVDFLILSYRDEFMAGCWPEAETQMLINAL